MSSTKQSITKKELGKILQEKFAVLNMDAKEIEMAIDEFWNTISDALIHGDRVELRGLGSFSVKIRKPRMVRNPKTREMSETPQRAVISFKQSKSLIRR